MFNRRIASVALAACMGVSILSGCGGKDEASADPSVSVSQEGGVIAPTGTAMPSSSVTPTVNSTDSATPIPSDSGDTGIQIEPSGAATAPSTDPTAAPAPTGGLSAPPTTAPTSNAKKAGQFCSTADIGTSTRASNGSTLMCDTKDGTPQWVVKGGSAATKPTGGSSTGSTGSTGSLIQADGTTILAKITKTTKIYSQADITSPTIGNARVGRQFKGTVSKNGNWVKIDRSAGYINADSVSVITVLK